MAYITVDKLNYSYGELEVIKNMDLMISDKQNITIIGPSSSGKTTLLKLLTGNLFGKGDILIDGSLIKLNNILEFRKKIGVVFDDGVYNKEIVLDELRSNLYNLVLSTNETNERLEEVIEFFQLNSILNEKLCDLKASDLMLIKILSVLITLPSIICFDDVIGYLTREDQDKLYRYLKIKGIYFINVTSNIEETLRSEYLICLYDKQIAVCGETLLVLKEEKILRRLGFNLPFYVDLSIQLSYYGIVSEINYSKEDLVASIWK